jgi:siroheme synthase-like protein
MTSEPLDMLRFLPVGLNIQDKSCLVVGGGEVGSRKVRNLLRAGARVTVVSPAVSDEIAEHVRAGRVRWVKAPLRDEHLADTFLVVAATDDEALNAEVVRRAEERGALVCDASSAERTQVIFGALHDAAGATVAVFTDGRDPAAARDLRNRIAGLLAADDQRDARP